jgi:hypothetical protein
METGVALGLRVNPDERGRRHTSAFDHVELFQRRGPGTRVRGDGKAGFPLGERRGSHQLRVNSRQGTLVNADLHEGRLDPGVVDAAFALADPSRRELFSGFVERVGREVLVVRRPVIAGVRQDVELRCLGQPPQQPRVAAEVCRRALDQRAASEPLDVVQVGQHRVEGGVGVVS